MTEKDRKLFPGERRLAALDRTRGKPPLKQPVGSGLNFGAGTRTTGPARKQLKKLDGRGPRTGGTRALIGGGGPSRTEKNLTTALDRAVRKSAPRGTSRGALLKAKANRQLAGDLISARGDSLSATSRENVARIVAESGLSEQALRNTGSLDTQTLASASREDIVDTQEAGSNTRTAAQERGALHRVGAAGDEARRTAEQKEGFASTQGTTAYREALGKAATSRAATDQQRQLLAEQLGMDERTIQNPQVLDALVALSNNPGSPLYKELTRLLGGEALADGGLVEGFADGGAIPFGGTPDQDTLGPAVQEYAQYVATATEHNLEPVPLGQFMNLMEAGQQKLQQAPGSAAGPTAGFADGGAIPASGRQVLDETGTPDMAGTDGIPAVIDGERPASLTSGEFVIPAEVVKAKGTEFFEKLIAQYKTEAA